MSISIEQAKALCAVVDYGGISRASEKLNKSHTSLIYFIKSFEDTYKVQLFNRTGYRNTLTEFGEQIYRQCQNLILQAEKIEDMAINFHNGWETKVKIVYDGSLPFDPFLKLYKKVQNEKNPTIIQNYSSHLSQVEKNFDEINADLMISIIPSQRTDLKLTPLKPFKFVLVAHKDHVIHKSKRKWAEKDLSQFSFLTIKNTEPQLGLSTSVFEDSARFYLSDFSLKKEALLKKVGFGWLPEHMIENELKNKILLPVKWERKSYSEVQPLLYTRLHSHMGLTTQLIIDFFKNL